METTQIKLTHTYNKKWGHRKQKQKQPVELCQPKKFLYNKINNKKRPTEIEAHVNNWIPSSKLPGQITKME